MHKLRLLTFFSCLLLWSGTAEAQPTPAGVHPLGPDLEVRRLADGVWMHTTWHETESWGRVPSNGLVVVSEGEALLVDTAWGDDPTERLLGWVRDTLQAAVARAVVTHAHDDRMLGIAVLHRAGVPVYALNRTAAWAAQQGLPLPDSLFEAEQVLPVGDRSVEVFFPGAGHTPDNVVAWLGDEALLFGGCMIKDAAARSLGNLGDAVVAAWPGSVRRLQERYGAVRVVVPSHGPPGDARLLEHTLELLEAHRRKPAGG